MRGLSPQVRPRSVASNWTGPTEGNGTDQPRGELHVALIAPDATTAALWRQRARVIIPPLWRGGRVQLHVVTVDTSISQNADERLLLAMIDIGLVDAHDTGIIGYPSGYDADETPT